MYSPATPVKNLDRVFTAVPHLHVCPRSQCCLFIQFGLTTCPQQSLSAPSFPFISTWRVYVNLHSRFSPLNVVTASLNRMRDSCNSSLYKRYTGWPECRWINAVWRFWCIFEMYLLVSSSRVTPCPWDSFGGTRE